MTTKNTELLPCPFCNQEPFLTNNGLVVCQNTNCADVNGMYPDNWNTRSYGKLTYNEKGIKKALVEFNINYKSYPCACLGGEPLCPCKMEFIKGEVEAIMKSGYLNSPSTNEAR